ncbi:MAG: hypothetical protein ABI783_10890, partial [Actinomycetota bacterium]
ARKFYEAAVDLWPEDEASRPQLFFRYAQAVHLIEPLNSVAVLTEARDVLLSVGDSGTAAETEILIGETFWLQGEQDALLARVRAAEALVADAPSSYSKAYVVANVSRFAVLAGENDDATRLGRQALAMAEEFGIDELRSHALNNMGIARVQKGDVGGVEDLEKSIAIAVAANSPESVRGYGNLASILMDLGELERAYAMNAEGLRLGERFGLADWLLWLRSERIWKLYFEGAWDDALSQLDELIAEFIENQFWMETPCRWLRGRIRLARGDGRGAQEDAERALERAEVAKDPQVLWPALGFGARAFVATDSARGEGFASRLLSDWQEHGLGISGSDSEWMVDLSVVLVALGKQAALVELMSRATAATPWRKAAALYVSGHFGKAADVYAEIGALPEEAYARLREAERLVSDGRRGEGDRELQRSLAFWRSVGATAYVLEGEQLLAEAG